MFNPVKLRYRILMLCFWLAVCPTVWELNRLHAEGRASRNLDAETLPTIELAELDEKVTPANIGIYPGGYLTDQLRVLGRDKHEIVGRFIALLPSEMSAIFSGLDKDGNGMEILSLYMVLSHSFNVAAGKSDIYSDIAKVSAFKSATLDRYMLFKKTAETAAKFLVGGWLFRHSALTQLMGKETKKFVDVWKELGGLTTTIAKYNAVRAYNITDDSIDLVVESFRRAGNGTTMKVLKGVGNVLGFVDLAFSSYNFATNEEWTYLFSDGVMTFQQVKATVELATAILGLACFSLGPVAAAILLLVALIIFCVDLIASSLKEWGLKFIDCHEILAQNDPSFSSFIGQIDANWAGSFPQKVYSAIQRQAAQYPPEVYTSDAVQQLEGLKQAVLKRFVTCRHYNAYDVMNIDYRNNLKVIAEKWSTKADAQSDWWWWPQFNPFNTRQESAEKQYFGDWYYGSGRVGENDARWCYFNYDFFLIKLFNNMLKNFETSEENKVKINDNPVIRIVQNRIQMAPFHYFPMVLNLMEFQDAGSYCDDIDKFIYLCTYCFNIDMAITAIRESAYFLRHMKASCEQYSQFENSINQMQESCFGLITENADYITGIDLLKEAVFNYIDDPGRELTEDKLYRYKKNLNFSEPDEDKMTYEGLVKKNLTKMNAIIHLLPLKAMGVSAKIVLLKTLIKQHFVRRAYLKACVERYEKILDQLNQADPFLPGIIEGLGSPPASYPPGKAFVDGVITVKDKADAAISFNFTAGGEFWNPGSNLMLMFNNTVGQIRSNYDDIYSSLYWAERAIETGNYNAEGLFAGHSLNQINGYCARIMRIMRNISRKIEDTPTTDLKVVFRSDNPNIFLMKDSDQYEFFKVTDTPPRVFDVPDLAWSDSRNSPLEPSVDTGVPDFYEMMVGEP